MKRIIKEFFAGGIAGAVITALFSCTDNRLKEKSAYIGLQTLSTHEK